MNKPSNVKGTKDFGHIQIQKRNYIFDTIKEVFMKFGFLNIETPALETTNTLLGKYGEEGDRLIYKIMPRGQKVNQIYEKLKTEKNISIESFCEEALRYDLTVPFARFISQHQHKITFPFKRYQIQPVWRADRPQKGRYREFYQCDADIVGSNSIINELEIFQIINLVFQKLNLPNIEIKINHRKILYGIAEFINEPNKIIDITTTIDKIDKIGLDKVNEELIERGLSENSIKKLNPILKLKGDLKEKLETLKSVLQNSKTGKEGIFELETLINMANSLNEKNISLDITLARGLNYYTGVIIEVIHNKFNSSICGGGRYDNLTEIFGLKNTSGVGISFGADRILDLIESLNLFPENLQKHSTIMFVNFGNESLNQCLKLANNCRKNNISTLVYPDEVKLKKQLKYANNLNINFVAIIGEEEIKKNKITIKNMISGEQIQIDKNDLLKIIHNN